MSTKSSMAGCLIRTRPAKWRFRRASVTSQEQEPERRCERPKVMWHCLYEVHVGRECLLRGIVDVDQARGILLKSTKLFFGRRTRLRLWQRSWGEGSGRPFRRRASLWRSNLRWFLWQRQCSRLSFECLHKRSCHPLWGGQWTSLVC